MKATYQLKRQQLTRLLVLLQGRISMLIVLSNNNLLLQRNPLMVTKRDEPTKQGDSALKGLIIILCIIYQVTW